MLCAYAFPDCLIESDHTSVRLPLCFEDCMATHFQYCYNDWVLIEEKKVRNIFIKSRGYFRLPNCSTLPHYLNRTAGIINNKPPTCTYIGLTELKEEEISCKLIN